MPKLPPCSKALCQSIKKGAVPEGFINLWIGTSAWELGTALSDLSPDKNMLLPAWLHPFDYFWPVRLCKILIVDTSYQYASKEYLEDLVYCLYKSGAEDVRALDPACNLTIYKKG
jgi:hypothetical protein